MVRAEVAGKREHLLALFEPNTGVPEDKSLLALEAAVLPDENNYVTLVLENLGAEPYYPGGGTDSRTHGCAILY